MKVRGASGEAFTLLETAIALGLAASLAVTAISFLATAGNVARRMDALRQAQEHADLIMRVVTGTVRPSGTGGGPAGVVAGTESSLTLRVPSGTVAFENSADGDALMRRGSEVRQLNLPETRAHLAFRYVGSSGAVFPRCGDHPRDPIPCRDVRAVRLEVTVESRRHPGIPVQMETSVALRGAGF